MSLGDIPKCAFDGCENLADPRWYIHDHEGKAKMACDGHGNPGCNGNPCTCYPEDILENKNLVPMPSGAECEHPNMKECHPGCKHFYCLDCELAWDEGAEL